MNAPLKHTADATTVEEGLAIAEAQDKQYTSEMATETAMANTLLTPRFYTTDFDELDAIGKSRASGGVIALQESVYLGSGNSVKRTEQIAISSATQQGSGAIIASPPCGFACAVPPGDSIGHRCAPGDGEIQPRWWRRASDRAPGRTREQTSPADRYCDTRPG